MLPSSAMSPSQQNQVLQGCFLCGLYTPYCYGWALFVFSPVGCNVPLCLLWARFAVKRPNIDLELGSISNQTRCCLLGAIVTLNCRTFSFCFLRGLQANQISAPRPAVETAVTQTCNMLSFPLKWLCWGQGWQLVQLPAVAAETLVAEHLLCTIIYKLWLLNALVCDYLHFS